MEKSCFGTYTKCLYKTLGENGNDEAANLLFDLALKDDDPSNTKAGIS